MKRTFITTIHCAIIAILLIVGGVGLAKENDIEVGAEKGKKQRFTFSSHYSDPELDDLDKSDSIRIEDYPTDIEDDPIEGELIEIIIQSGGSYAVIESDGAQLDWADLAGYLERYEPTEITEIPFPMSIRYYDVAREGEALPTFLITPKKNGEVTILVDGRGNIVPDLKVDNRSIQTQLGEDLYGIRFNVKTDQTYAVELNKSLYESSLYSIVARFKEFPY